MNSSILIRISTVVLIGTLCAGCTVEDNARQIIEYNTDAGKVMENIRGTGEQLVRAGSIDLHRRYKAPDGVEIDVWVLKAKQVEEAKSSRGTIVILHGLTESKASFPYFNAGKVLARKGYDVVLSDLRAHGRSGGRYVTYGAKEKYDVKAVVDGLLGEGEIAEPIYVFGATLGAATAIQYAAIDPRCKGVMAMTAYKDARSIARGRLPFVSAEDFKAAMEKAGQMAKFDPDEASSVKAAAKLTNTPLLLVYGILDLTVPGEHGEAIFKAAGGPKKLILKPLLDWAIMGDWIADRVEELATKGLPSEGE